MNVTASAICGKKTYRVSEFHLIFCQAMKNLSSRSQFPVPHTARTKKNNVAAQENGTKELAPAFATERCLGAKQRGDKSNSSYVCILSTEQATSTSAQSRDLCHLDVGNIENIEEQGKLFSCNFSFLKIFFYILDQLSIVHSSETC